VRRLRLVPRLWLGPGGLEHARRLVIGNAEIDLNQSLISFQLTMLGLWIDGWSIFLVRSFLSGIFEPPWDKNLRKLSSE
jgi:hypothetical protein